MRVSVSSVLLFVLVVALSVSLSDALCTCKKATEAVGPCSVALDVCGCVKGLHWKYKCSADAAGGGHGEYEWSKSGDGAAKNAILALFQSMATPGQCNGSAGTAPVGTCSIPYNVFFYFANESDLDNKVVSYKATASYAGSTGSVSAQTGAEDAVKAAVTALITANPAIAGTCGL